MPDKRGQPFSRWPRIIRALSKPVHHSVIFIATLALLILLFIFTAAPTTAHGLPRLSPYPHGKNFAFTITDDPDYTTFERIKPIYDFFSEIGLKTTVAVWVRNPERSNGMPDKPRHSKHPSDSCQRPEYLAYVRHLQAHGFEIALHTVSAGNDPRSVTEAGYEDFRQMFGHYPAINIMHSDNLENIYWGPYTFNNHCVRSILRMFPGKPSFPWGGHDPNSMYFCGDIIKTHTKYVRMLGTSNINTLKFNPSMPYHDPRKPYVNYWFSFSDGFNGKTFLELTSHNNVKRLVEERGASIVYTHFSAPELRSARGLNLQFVSQMSFLVSQKEGWFVPASELLDRLLLMKGVDCFSLNGKTIVHNRNAKAVDGLTLLVRPGEVWRHADGSLQTANDQGEIVLGNLWAGKVLLLQRGAVEELRVDVAPGFREQLGMILERSYLFLKHIGRRA